MILEVAMSQVPGVRAIIRVTFSRVSAITSRGTGTPRNIRNRFVKMGSGRSGSKATVWLAGLASSEHWRDNGRVL